MKTMINIKHLGLAALVSTSLLTPVITQAGNFDQAVKDATIQLDKAKAVNYEWRDSRKLLKKAEKLNKEGKKDKAMKLVAKAKNQGKLAVVQAELQSGVSGPR